MRFRTEIEPLRHAGLISSASRIVMVGSCFTDEVGRKLSDGGFDVAVNPFGTLYNPESMAAEIERAALSTPDADDWSTTIVQRDGHYVSLRRHSSFNDADPDALIRRLASGQSDAGNLIRKADILIATFGSAIAFRHKPSGNIVANCHKLPGHEFTRETISVENIAERWTTLIGALRQTNPSLKVILTVSPVRHVGYGLVADRISKSTLTLACTRIADTLPDVIYFPSYEIMVDDLRDYRFYADDLVHPSAMAVEYIHDIFRRSFMSAETIAGAELHAKEMRRQCHRPLMK